MLEIIVPETELWDEIKQEFLYTKETKLLLEHSLVSISKWESRWHKPYLSKDPKTDAEVIDYVRCMTIGKKVDHNVYNYLSYENIEQIKNYIENPMTATRIPSSGTRKKNNQPITSELIYYMMIQHGIPFEFQKWHLNRLLILIEVCNYENGPKKKVSKTEIMRRNSELNAARKKQLRTRG